MKTKKIYDVIGIGIGPFNLGLAALLQDHPSISYLFLDEKPAFDWHPGLLLPGARMQVPYFADLVTLANPQSRYTYINYLHTQKRLFRFGVQENIYPLRTEYNRYAQWAASQLPGLRFGTRCERITYHAAGKHYTVQGAGNMFHAKHLVIGVGAEPFIPEGVKVEAQPTIIHAAHYLQNKNALLARGDVTLVGSGQSAAEIFDDLLQHHQLLRGLHWFTRARCIAPMDDSRFALEMATPDYVDYFFALPAPAKAEVLATQAYLYKGINRTLVEKIHDQLCGMAELGAGLQPKIHPATELHSATPTSRALQLTFRHRDTGIRFTHAAGALILATGYHYAVPTFLAPIRDRIQWTDDGRYRLQKHYAIDADSTIFVQNADLHSHGFNSADLGMGTYRNMVILNRLLGRVHYGIERDTAFQSFGPPA